MARISHGVVVVWLLLASLLVGSPTAVAAAVPTGPHLCDGGPGAVEVHRLPKYLVAEVEWLALYERDVVCVPSTVVCSQHLSTRGRRSSDVPAGFRLVDHIVCRGPALGIAPSGESYIRYFIERIYTPDGHLITEEYVSELVEKPVPVLISYPSYEPSYAPRAKGIVRSASSILEIGASYDFEPADADVLRLYFAFFDREPDLEGAKYWIALSRQGVTLDEIAGYFAASEEFSLRFGSPTNQAFLRIVYANVLGRDFDQGGFDYWLDLLERGALSRGGTVRWVAANDEFIIRHPYGGRDAPPPDGDRWAPHEIHPYTGCFDNALGHLSRQNDGSVLLTVQYLVPFRLDGTMAPACYWGAQRLGIDDVDLNGRQGEASWATKALERHGFIRTLRAVFPADAWDEGDEVSLTGSVSAVHEIRGAFVLPLDSIEPCALFCS